MRQFAADLHIHTALSPCASDEMTPPAIVAAAITKGLAMIAICDHNTTANTGATREAARDALCVLAGMELTTAEEVHVLGIFPNDEMAGRAGQAVREALPNADESYYRKFGRQLRMDAHGGITGIEPKMLAAASPLDLSEAVELIRKHGGLAIASHVDRPSYSVISQLGMFPPDVRFDAVEVSRHAPPGSAKRTVVPPNITVVTSSDSHFLEDIGACRTLLDIQEPTFSELGKALAHEAGRRCHA